MKTITASIKGVSPLLMSAFRVMPDNFRNLNPTEQAELRTYRIGKTRELYLPVENLTRAMISGAVYSKGKGRASLQKNVAAAVFLSPIHIMLGTKEFALDSRSVVIPATRGRIICHRPRINEWTASFKIDFDDALISAAQVEQILWDTGNRVGLMDFRPERKGPFGRFEVTSFKGN